MHLTEKLLTEQVSFEQIVDRLLITKRYWEFIPQFEEISTVSLNLHPSVCNINVNKEIVFFIIFFLL